jgi:hypothetical protein
MKFVSFYEMAPGAMDNVKEHYPAFVTNGLVAKWRVVEWNAAFM